MLNAQWLETFTALSETGSMTRTAAALNMTQPGVSQHVKKLEAQLGTPLLRRDGRSFTLTPAGERVRALGLARRAEEARLRAGIGADDPDRGRISVACPGGFAMMLYPRLLRHAATRPALDLVVEAAPQTTILDGVAEGRFDYGLLHHAPDHRRVTGTRIGSEELCLLYPADADPGQPSLADLEQRGLIAHPDAALLADLLLAPNYPEDYPGGDRLRQRGRINQLGQIPMPVSVGIGYTVLPRSGLAGFAHRERLRIIPLPHRVRQDLWLISRRGRQMPARLDAAERIIRATAAALDDDGGDLRA